MLNRYIFSDDRSWQYYIASHYIDWYWTQNGKPNKKHASWLFEVPGLHSKRGPGITCLTSLQEMMSGTDPDNDSKGCGGIMRVAPIALCADFRERMPKELVYMIAGKSAFITHKAPLGFIPAAFLVMLLDKIMHFEGEINRLSLEKLVWDCMKEIPKVRLDYSSFKGTYSQFTKDIDELERLVKMAMTLVPEGGADVENIERLGGGWTGETALAIALYCAMKHADSFEDAVIAAVNHSGDSDSTGAICGNIMGLIYGYDDIPAHFKEHLELLPVLKEVATDLYTGAAGTKDKAAWKKKYLEGHRVAQL